jgi:hypothetical protein
LLTTNQKSWEQKKATSGGKTGNIAWQVKRYRCDAPQPNRGNEPRRQQIGGLGGYTPGAGHPDSE